MNIDSKVKEWLDKKGYIATAKIYNKEGYYGDQDLPGIITRAIKDLNLIEADQWISCEDRMPEEREFNYLIMNSEGIEIAQYHDAMDDGSDYMGHDKGWFGTYAHPSRSFGNPEYMHEAQGQPTHWKLIT